MPEKGLKSLHRITKKVSIFTGESGTSIGMGLKIFDIFGGLFLKTPRRGGRSLRIFKEIPYDLIK